MILSDQLEFDDKSPLIFVINENILINMGDFVHYRCSNVKSTFGVTGWGMDS